VLKRFLLVQKWFLLERKRFLLGQKRFILERKSFLLGEFLKVTRPF